MVSLIHSVTNWKKANKSIPGGTNTISKRVDAFAGIGHFPAFAEKGEGAYLEDIDGNRYLDYIAALAPIIIGYNDKRINEKIVDQLSKGVLFSLPTLAEIELSELLIEVIPCAEMVKLLKTGAEANSAAIRAARLHTNRELILSCGYQGWHDWWVVNQSQSGIPEQEKHLTLTFDFNDLKQAERLVQENKGKVACIILTAALYGCHPEKGFLSGLRELADRNGIVLIFDEVITGFRWALGGAQSYYGITPDLATFGKAMANGMPLAALVGKHEIMQPLKNNWITSTYASEALSIVAAIETIKILKNTNTIEQLYSHAKRLRAGLKNISARNQIEINVNDLVPVVVFDFNNKKASEENFQDNFLARCADKGVLLRKEKKLGFSMCLMAALTEQDLDETLLVIESVVQEILL